MINRRTAERPVRARSGILQSAEGAIQLENQVSAVAGLRESLNGLAVTSLEVINVDRLHGQEIVDINDIFLTMSTCSSDGLGHCIVVDCMGI